MKKRRDFIRQSIIGTTGLVIGGTSLASATSGQVKDGNNSIISPSLNLQTQNRSEKSVYDFSKFKKLDLHMHITSDALYLREVMDSYNLKMLVMVNEGLKVERLKVQTDVAIDLYKKHPRYFTWLTTFGFERMYDADYADRVKEDLKFSFDNGAVGVKVWKDIGMQVKNLRGELVQIDDPIFDPILNYIQAEGKTLFTHIGDPVSNWLYFDQNWRQNRWYTIDPVNPWNRVGDFSGEVSYDKMLLAYERMLSKNPNLRIIGCHLASMSFDLDVLARVMDKYPNFAVETSSTMSSLMGQARGKVRSFFIKYQDRIMYALDKSGGLVATDFFVDMTKVNERWTPERVVEEKKELIQAYNREFTYYCTDDVINVGDYSIRGLALPDDILQKFFYSNAVKWVPGINKAFI